MTDASTLPRTQNETWGFYGTMIQYATRDGETDATADATATAAWDAAMTAIAVATDAEPDGVRTFLDSRHGRYFADDVCNYLNSDSTLADAIDSAAKRWLTWTTKRRDERATGIPAGMPFLVAYVIQANIEAGAGSE